VSEIVKTEMTMLAIEAAFIEPGGDFNAAYIWTRDDGIDSATLKK
jgi:translation elongation factor EF-Ts